MLSNNRKYYSSKAEGKERLCTIKGDKDESNRYSVLDFNYVLGYLDAESSSTLTRINRPNGKIWLRLVFKLGGAY